MLPARPARHAGSFGSTRLDSTGPRFEQEDKVKQRRVGTLGFGRSTAPQVAELLEDSAQPLIASHTQRLHVLDVRPRAGRWLWSPACALQHCTTTSSDSISVSKASGYLQKLWGCGRVLFLFGTAGLSSSCMPWRSFQYQEHERFDRLKQSCQTSCGSIG